MASPAKGEVELPRQKAAFEEWRLSGVSRTNSEPDSMLVLVGLPYVCSCSLLRCVLEAGAGVSRCSR